MRCWAGGTRRPQRFKSKNACHPGRSEAESRDPGAAAVRLPLGPGSASPPGMTRFLSC
ncbi:hypothetical protein [Caulobacter sp.]|uniref:hypothetical protein n=1 Tax=Caulobacter sp. TaxID=78 RepID=UPI003BAB4402